MCAPSLRFTRRQRIKRQRDFDRVFARRMSSADANLVVYADLNGLEHSRLGLVVSRRLGGAVVRNRIKRRIREAYRICQHDLPRGMDIVCIPRAGEPRSVDEYTRSLGRLLPKLYASLADSHHP